MVYPRVGGGNLDNHISKMRVEGLSPRGRGKPLYEADRICGRRSIPAWAGETRGTLLAALVSEVYPRVGGGNADELPRLRTQMGLSPRGRGKPLAMSTTLVKPRSIPAWAGETDSKYRLPPAR